MTNDINTSLKTMLASAGMNQSQLGELLHMQKQNVSRLLNKDDFRLSELIKISNLLNYDIEINFINKSNGTIINCDLWQIISYMILSMYIT